MFNKNDTHAGHKINDSGHSGAQGIVHHANRIIDNEEVALKLFILNSDEPLDYARFKFENTILFKLSPHDNIVRPVSNVRHDGKLAHYTMEYLPQDLSTYAQMFKSDEFPFDKKLRLAIGICRGLAHAHSNNIYHRDLHPQNVRIDGLTMTAKISDFGLGKVIGSSLHSHIALLAWGYGVRPPEAKFMTSDNPTDDYYRSGDIYALGITIHYIFAASIEQYVYRINNEWQKFLFMQGVADPNDFEALRKKYTETERRSLFETWLKQINPAHQELLRIELAEVEQAKKLTKILEKMCALDPSKRYTTVQSIITELKSL